MRRRYAALLSIMLAAADAALAVIVVALATDWRFGRVGG